jgi:hypothetical protein
MALAGLVLSGLVVLAQDAGGIVGSVIGPAPQRPAAPPRDRQPNGQRAAAGNSTISGRVTSLDGAPLRRTQVQLAGAPIGGRTTQTDSDGRYSFAALPAGKYTIRVSRGGYVNLAYGQRTPTDPTKPIELADGQALSGVDIVLPRGGAITGRVLDEFGEPMLQAQVQAYRYQYQPGGERTLQPGGGSAVTDDLGQFRLYGLNPGDYVISATSRNQVMQMVAGGAGSTFTLDGPDARTDEGYAPTFYPGTANPGEAQPVNLGLGQELSVQLQLVPAHLARISGMVFDSQGRPVTGSVVMLRSSATVIGPNRSANSGADGSFTITGVAPGEYYVEVRPRPQPPAGNGGGPGGRGGNANATTLPEQEFASVPVNVGGDVTGLHIVTGKGATISGRVVFEGTPPSNGLRIRVVSQPADPSRSIALPNVRAQDEGFVSADGSFELTRITGPIFLRVQLTSATGPPPPQVTYMTKSVIVDGVDVADTPFDPTRRGGTSNITLVLTDKVTDIGGVVTDGRGTPLGSSMVLIVPEDLPPGVSPARYHRILQSDGDGKFSVRGMPPGRYAAIAANGVDAAHQYDPATVQRVRQRGQSFSVREGETVTLALNLTTDF